MRAPHRGVCGVTDYGRGVRDRPRTAFLTTRSSAGDRSLWQPGDRRGQVGRSPGKVRGVLGKGSAPEPPRYEDYRAGEDEVVSAPSPRALLVGRSCYGESVASSCHTHSLLRLRHTHATTSVRAYTRAPATSRPAHGAQEGCLQRATAYGLLGLTTRAGLWSPRVLIRPSLDRRRTKK